ncbi:hypothetical protein ACVKXF_002724 [Curtobacterium sp. PvP017]
MRVVSIGRSAGTLGALGVTIQAADDFTRIFFESPMAGSSAVLAGASIVLLLIGGVLSWRGDRIVCWTLGALAVQVVGRMAVDVEPMAVYWSVSVAHMLGPVLALAIGVVIARRAGSTALCRLGCIIGIAAGCWMLASWTQVPLLLVPLTRALTDGCLLAVVVWPAVLEAGRLVRRLWDSAEVR